MSPGNVLSTVTVAEAMRRQLVRADPELSIDRCVARMVKYKTGVVLVEEEDGTCVGVVSKTDLGAMYYAGLGLDTRLGEVATGEPVCCRPGDRLETALTMMLDQGIRRVYVWDGDEETITGLVGYTDIVGAVYRFCIQCRRNLHRSGALRPGENDWLTVADVMHWGVIGCSATDSLRLALEYLLEGGMGAVAVVDESGARAAGVVSMSDMVLAYRHGVDLRTRVDRIMAAPALACRQNDYLSSALRIMIYSDVQRIFVYDPHCAGLVGVISLTDAARARSGACRACRVARL